MSGHGFALHAHISLTETPDGAVLLNQRTGRYWQLNPNAVLVLRVLREGGTREQAAAALVARHPAAADRARGDVEALVNTLRDAGAVASPAGENGPP